MMRNSWSQYVFLRAPPPKKYSFLHEKGQRSYDSTGVKGVMKLCLVGIFHCCIDDDPPPSEKLHQSQARTCTSDVNRVKTGSAASDIKQKADATFEVTFYLWGKHKCRSNTRTPAATDAMAFLLSPQSTLHSQSPHRIPSRNPDMTAGKSVSGRNNRQCFK